MARFLGPYTGPKDLFRQLDRVGSILLGGSMAPNEVKFVIRWNFGLEFTDCENTSPVAGSSTEILG